MAPELRVHDITLTPAYLEASGLLHSTSDGRVFASRAAVRQIQLVGHGVI